MTARAVLSFQVSMAFGNEETRHFCFWTGGRVPVSHPLPARGEGRKGWGRGRMEQAFWVVFVPCPGYMPRAGLGLLQYMAKLPLHRAGSFWNFSSAFTCPVGERDSHCQLFICKLAYEPFCKSIQASNNHKANRPGFSVYFQDAYKTVKIKMWLIRNRDYIVRFSCSKLAWRPKHSL